MTIFGGKPCHNARHDGCACWGLLRRLCADAFRGVLVRRSGQGVRFGGDSSHNLEMGGELPGKLHMSSSFRELDAMIRPIQTCIPTVRSPVAWPWTPATSSGFAR
eukprot:4721556-Pleurochrysis_carterae.AAC.2